MITLEDTPEMAVLVKMERIFRCGNKKEKKTAKKGLTKLTRGHRHNNPIMVIDGCHIIDDAYQSLCERIQ